MPRLLLVEDDPAIREMMARRLELRGYAVTTAADGEAGLAAALADPPAAVLLDASLPGMSGWEVARALRADPRAATLPIIAVTAHAGVNDKKAALAAGCTVFFAKPVDFNRLVSALSELVGPPEPP
jgi:two-component system, cell cycle response regulator DivK